MPVIIITHDQMNGSRPARHSSHGERRSASDSSLSGLRRQQRSGEDDRVEVGDREMRGGDRMRARKRVSAKRRHARKRKVV